MPSYFLIVILILVLTTFYTINYGVDFNDERSAKIVGRASNISYFILFVLFFLYALAYKFNFLSNLYVDPFNTSVVILTISSSIHALLIFLFDKRFM